MDRECIFCGTLLENSQYVCEECQEKVDLLKMIKKVDSAKTKIEKANKKFFGRTTDYSNERKAIITKIIDNKNIFKSTEEICFAMQLEREKIKYYPNFKIGAYSVDFLLPTLRKIVEIDGEIYHTGEKKENEMIRDRLINHVVGMDYDFVRIPSTYVPGYTLRNIKDILDFVVDKRNFDRRNKNTNWDKQYLEQYIYLQSFLKRGGSKRCKQNNIWGN